MDKTALGDRMKSYESVFSGKLTPNSCVIIRIDGKAFHTFTKSFEKPFDYKLILAMQVAMCETAKEMQGFKIGYAQSDEASFLITDYDKHNTDGWFGYNLNKIVSISASIFTMNFNKKMQDLGMPSNAIFDARAFNVPKDDVPNYFVWRQKDFERNSIQMLAQSHFSHKQLHKKSNSDMQEMLFKEKGVNWADLPDVCKNGTFFLKNRKFLINDKVNYEFLQKMIEEMMKGGQF